MLLVTKKIVKKNAKPIFKIAKLRVQIVEKDKLTEILIR